MKRILVLTATGMLLATMIAGPAAAQPGVTATTQVHATVARQATYNVVSDGIVLVKANTPWRLIAETADGQVMTMGSKTSGTEVVIPIDTEVISLVMD